ncbi:hypothetical protein J4G53_24460 [Serratia ureilytica]|uniref:Uncharacterized protein n=1 Tax=Serratia ureilytica TaxID=300181 RepID=A0ABU0VS39_9GAMM|nr:MULTISPECIES: hypothetical protein [Serratia]ALL39025.1 hypothetical protein AR325_19360 [Serratia marcescens]MBH2897277.1 hypothetical protein [Serratia ureilytica]MBJ2092854.1 hypothetical protein [Serratia ureilytica]MBN5446612.1 hypothetical protein [Serratia ureilytica]MBO1811392.1 hypothetical protein [Serratia ureilytica]
MTRLITLVARAIISPEKILKKIADVTSSCDNAPKKAYDDKFFIDSNGSVVLNRNNAEVQKAFADNIAGLSTNKTDKKTR